MNFNSLQYLLFLPATILVYYTLRPKWRNGALLVLSYYFYACWQPVYALLMLLSTVITYLCGLLLEKQVGGHKKLWLVLSLLLNLSILFFFKYFNFAAIAITGLLDKVGLLLTIPRLDLLLPVGISFYTFQALGYTIDVYRGDIASERSFCVYALFVSFFPQLVAGPIERCSNMLPQFQQIHRFSFANIKEGLLPVLWGLFKKMVLADQLAVLVNTAYGDPGSFTGMQLLFATLCFAVQIYCDFSAYSDIARGSAAMLGFQLMRNFNAPYFAVSVKDFWRRWHISLSSWFKDYLYFPLGGSRCAKWRMRLNLMIVFAVSGLWHGAAFTFLIWGLLNGIYQVLGDLLKPLRQKAMALLHLGQENLLRKTLQRLLTFGLICLAWVFFRADTLPDALAILSTMFADLTAGRLFPLAFSSLGLSRSYLLLLGVCVCGLFAVDGLSLRYDLPARINQSLFCRYAIYFALILLILIFGSYPQDFVYFQF